MKINKIEIIHQILIAIKINLLNLKKPFNKIFKNNNNNNNKFQKKTMLIIMI